MSDMSKVAARAFHAELRKLAAPWHNILGTAGGGAGMGAAVGALGGAGIGAVKNYRAAKEQGQGTSGALAQGVTGALQGAGKGAIVGAGVGAVGGAGLGAVAPGMAGAMTHAPGALGSTARFGQRQLHAATEWVPEHGNVNSVSQLRMGTHMPSQALAAKSQELQQLRTSGAPSAAIDKAMAQHSKLETGLASAQKAQEMGLTSVPGYVKALANPKYSVGEVVGTAAKEQWHNMPTWAKAMTVGLPAAQAANALRGPDQDEAGHGRAERFMGAAGQAGLGMVTGGIPMMTGSVLQGAGTNVLNRTGRGIDKTRRRMRGGDGGIQAPRDNTVYGGETQATEHVMTERAQGHGPESPV